MSGKHRFLTVAVVLLSLVAGAWADSWETKADKAYEEAKASGKYILMDFSGSDWCRWCIKLENEVFKKSSFKNYAEENLVMMLVDFPNSKPQSGSLKKQNAALKEKYAIRGFPTVFVLSPKGETVGQTGYRDGGPDKYVDHLKEMIAGYEAKHGKPERPMAATGSTLKPAVALAAAKLGPSGSRAVRTWTSQAGSTVEASLYRELGTYVVLRQTDGSNLQIPASKLSAEDQEYLKVTRAAEAGIAQ